ncbi:hypothetical protein ABBQ38_002930 [Trebouxia sp. C0009 RCD-2024]
MYLVLTRVETVLLIKRFAVQIVAARSRTPMQVLRVALLVLAAALTEAQAPVFGGQYIGDGTYYGDQSGAGHCSFQFSTSYGLAWTTGVYTGVAVNAPQYDGSAPCGMCIAFQGTGPGSGANPISTSIQYAIATDECPECLTGALDLAQDGDGRWGISWYPVQCDVGSTTFQYSFAGSNAEYVKMAITNTRVPASAVNIQVNGEYQAMTKSTDNYWLATSGPYSFPTSVQVTSVLGDTVTDVVNVAAPLGAVVGGAQFPLSAAYEVVQGSGSTPAAPTTSATTEATAAATPGPTAVATPEPTPEPTTEATPQPTPAPTAEATPQATPAPIAEATPAPTSDPTAEATPQPAAEATPEATPAPTPETTVAATPEPAEATAPPATEPTIPTPTIASSPSTNSSDAIPAYASATTNYTVNASVPAPPVPPAAEVTAVPVVVPAGQQPASDIVTNMSTPSPSMSTTSPAVEEAVPSVNETLAPVTATSTAAGDSSLIRSPANCTLSVAALQQCGGRGGVCANQGADSSQCRDAQWDNACCSSGFYCQRQQQWSWTCERTEVGTNVSVGGQVADYRQCGGLGYCAQSLCADAKWTNYSCYTGFTCLRWDAFYWQCRDLPFAQLAISA